MVFSANTVRKIVFRAHFIFFILNLQIRSLMILSKVGISESDLIWDLTHDNSGHEVWNITVQQCLFVSSINV